MTTAAIDPYPWFLNKLIEVTVADIPVFTRISATEWTERYRPLLARIYELHQKNPRRILIAIAGPPGSGKSVLAEQLNWLVEKGILHDAHGIALPMDGFHFPNAYLQTHFRPLPDGNRIPLADVKGAPDTFDIASFKRHLLALRSVPEELAWPGYSRERHDVVPGLYRVNTSHSVIFIEGNYLLLDRGPFAGVMDLFDFRIYIDAPAAAIISNLMQRHTAGGKSVDIAKEWVKRIDLPNARFVEASRHHADVIVERSTDDELIALRWKGDPPPIE